MTPFSFIILAISANRPLSYNVVSKPLPSRIYLPSVFNYTNMTRRFIYNMFYFCTYFHILSSNAYLDFLSTGTNK